jgi:alpha-glucosidase
VGRRRARAAALLVLALPGSVYLYQGEELGLVEVEDLPEEALQDPIWVRSGGTARGRDGCRVPLPWSGDAPPFGFSRTEARPWLPQPLSWRALTVRAQEADAHSTLRLYRSALRLRRRLLRGAGDLTWSEAGPGALAFTRGRTRCLVNLSPGPLPLPDDEPVLLASEPGVTSSLPPDTAVWLQTAGDEGD